MKRIVILVLIIALVVSTMLTVVACGDKNDNDTNTTESIKIVDMAGDEVVLPNKIDHVVSTVNPCTNFMIALGLGNKISGAYKTFFNNPWLEKFYPNIKNVTKYNSYQPEAESLIAAGVDLVFVPTKDRADALRDKGICAVCIRFYNPEEVKNAVALLGVMFKDAKPKADKWLQYLDTTLSTVKEKWVSIEEADKPVAYEILADKYRGLFRTNYGMGQAWLEYGGGIIATKSFEDAYQTGQHPTEEAILATNPEIIFIGGTYCSQLEKDLYNDAKWSNISAVKTKNVHLVPVGACYWNDCSVEYPLMVYYVHSCMYPEMVDYDINKIAHDFYKEYYNVDFSEKEIQYMLSALDPNGEDICKDQIK